MYMPDFSKLEKTLGLKFNDKDLLSQAFCHRSYLNENPNFGIGHNERLEFLGDAVLELAVTEHLYQQYPAKPEGELTALRAALVNSKMLSQVARSLGFEDFLLLSQGEAKEKGKARQYILANTFEAFVGALYLDKNFKKVQSFIKKHLLKELPYIIKNQLYRDAKSRFQEEAQERVNITPTYEVAAEWGPDHAKHFRVAVFLGKDNVAEGEALPSRKPRKPRPGRPFRLRAGTAKECYEMPHKLRNTKLYESTKKDAEVSFRTFVYFRNS